MRKVYLYGQPAALFDSIFNQTGQVITSGCSPGLSIHSSLCQTGRPIDSMALVIKPLIRFHLKV